MNTQHNTHKISQANSSVQEVCKLPLTLSLWTSKVLQTRDKELNKASAQNCLPITRLNHPCYLAPSQGLINTAKS